MKPNKHWGVLVAGRDKVGKEAHSQLWLSWRGCVFNIPQLKGLTLQKELPKLNERMDLFDDMIFYGRSMKIFPHRFYLIQGNARLQSCFWASGVLIYFWSNTWRRAHLRNFMEFSPAETMRLPIQGIIDIDVHWNCTTKPRNDPWPWKIA